MDSVLALQPWHWVVFGVILVLSELLITTFFILWFGIAAILMGVLLLFLPMLALSTQVLLWTVLSVLFAVAWFKFLKPLSVDKTKAGLSKEAILGEVGQIISAPNGDRRGTLRFPVPILGEAEWAVITQDCVREGDRVRVIDVAGNALVVEAI
ncbi:NfeD family protein [Halioxenophilus aromaticivorans]|uniref:NfeD family protein n=1 Tax=Halioxenophilus aromaticivorans TaxID=1306992 RepID=A0AAV3U9C7_9ALTE